MRDSELRRNTPSVTVIGAGLAGCEAAWQLARHGVPCRLFEMRPETKTPVHRSADFAELVCSNSLRSDGDTNAHGILKHEMRALGSLILSVAEATRVPAGQALAVDREAFAQQITDRITRHPLIEVIRSEVQQLPASGLVIVASGPLTSQPLADAIHEFAGEDHLYFYDAISPVVQVDSVDFTIAFKASRYGKGGDDYINCPFSEQEYTRFYDALMEAAAVDLHEIDRHSYFESCLPIEVMARRGRDTLRFGPMKPVGLPDPRDGKQAHAVVQLRQDNLAGSLYNIVGFQNQLKWGEQRRVFRMIPGLQEAEFERYGMIHRNTYINSPRLLRPSFQSRKREELFFAGQLSGVEGYTESAASGLLAGLGAAAMALGRAMPELPGTTALGALTHYIANAEPDNYQPTNISFGLFAPLAERVRGRRARKQAIAARASADIGRFVNEWRRQFQPTLETDRVGASHED